MAGEKESVGTGVPVARIGTNWVAAGSGEEAEAARPLDVCSRLISMPGACGQMEDSDT
jgi:hypothetical protein